MAGERVDGGQAPGAAVTARPPSSSSPPLVPVVMIAKALGCCRKGTARVTMSEYGAQTQPPALPARTTPTASSQGDCAKVTITAPAR